MYILSNCEYICYSKKLLARVAAVFGAPRMRLHFVDPREQFLEILGEKLGAGFELRSASNDEDNELLDCDLIVYGLPLLGHEDFQKCLHRLQHLVRMPGSPPVIAFLPAGDRNLATIAVAAGAYDFFFESGSMEELRLVLRRAYQFRELTREIGRLRGCETQGPDFSTIVGADPKMAAAFQLASKVARTDATLLLTGETGTGKELLARAIHGCSRNSGQPFVAVACSSLPENLIEAELFGHERGAFTGAITTRKGRFEAAGEGTIFLDEIGELSPTLQVKLLRVLQERSFERLGSNQPHPMRARIICATNRDLREMVQQGQFRADLYYRLNTIEIKLPPLRERRTDILLLAYKFLRQYAEKHNRQVRRLSPATMAILEDYHWPGNVREMQNVIERAVVICEENEIRPDDLPDIMYEERQIPCTASFEDEVRSFKKRLIQRTLLEYGNNKLQAARSLKIARSSLHRLIDELQIGSQPPSVMN